MTAGRELVGGPLDGQSIEVPADQTTYQLDVFRHRPWAVLGREDADAPGGAHSLGVYLLGADGAFHWQGEA